MPRGTTVAHSPHILSNAKQDLSYFRAILLLVVKTNSFYLLVRSYKRTITQGGSGSRAEMHQRYTTVVLRAYQWHREAIHGALAADSVGLGLRLRLQS